jgi:hypothetical protein
MPAGLTVEGKKMLPPWWTGFVPSNFVRCGVCVTVGLEYRYDILWTVFVGYQKTQDHGERRRYPSTQATIR